MSFLPLLLLLLPILIDGYVYNSGKCDHDACLQYGGSCDNKTGGWTVTERGDKLFDSGCSVDDYLFIGPTADTPTNWKLWFVVKKYSKIMDTVVVTSPRLDLRRKEEGKWNLTIDGQTKVIKQEEMWKDASEILTWWRFDINETTPLVELFNGARFSAKVNEKEVTNDDQSVWTIMGQFGGPVGCSERDIKPAFLIVLIAFAVFSTIVAILLCVMIYCIGREAKYKPVPTSSEPVSSGTKSHYLNPELDPTTAGVKELPTAPSTEPSHTDISRLKTESKVSKKN